MFPELDANTTKMNINCSRRFEIFDAQRHKQRMNHFFSTVVLPLSYLLNYRGVFSSSPNYMSNHNFNQFSPVTWVINKIQSHNLYLTWRITRTKYEWRWKSQSNLYLEFQENVEFVVNIHLVYGANVIAFLLFWLFTGLGTRIGKIMTTSGNECAPGTSYR